MPVDLTQIDESKIVFNLADDEEAQEMVRAVAEYETALRVLGLTPRQLDRLAEDRSQSACATIFKPF